LCEREQKSRGGGQYHVYHAASIDLIEKATEHRLKEIQKSLSKLIRRFKEDIQQMIEQ
jgi:predicted transcriptional regulator